MYQTIYLMLLFAKVVDYDALRKNTAAVFDAKAQEVRGLVEKLQKTQRAAEQTLEKCACFSLRAALAGWRLRLDVVEGMRSHAPCNLCPPRCSTCCENCGPRCRIHIIPLTEAMPLKGSHEMKPPL